MAEGNGSKPKDSPELSERLARELHQAVVYGSADKVSSLLRQGANPNHQLYWSEEWTRGWWKMYPPLHAACKEGNLQIVKALVQGGADIDKVGPENDKHKTPFHYACARSHKEVMDYLAREAGCQVDVRDEDNKTPLHHACEWGKEDVVQYLVEILKCDFDVLDDEEQSPLDCALEHAVYREGCMNVARYLINHGCGGDKERVLLLCKACQCDKLNLVKELIEQYQIDPTVVRDEDNSSPLHWACKGRKKHVVQYLVEKVNCDINVRNHHCQTPLHWACEHGRIEVVQYLVEELKCDVDVVDDVELSPLVYALENKETEECVSVAIYLVNRGCACGDEEKSDLLCGACCNGMLEVVKELIEQYKVDPNADGYKRPPLHYACELSNKDVVEYLVEKAHCDVNVRDKEGQSTLGCVLESMEGYDPDSPEPFDVAFYLISHGCDSDKEKSMLLVEACKRGKLDVVKKLIEKHHIDPNGVREDKGRSPMESVFYGLNEYDIDLDDIFPLALYLLNHGCNDEDKAKLICEACYWNRLEVVKELIEQHNVEPSSVKDDKGQSLLDIALKSFDMYGGVIDQVSLYLINCGCGGDEAKAKLLCYMCHWGKLDVVKELIEQHGADPNGARDDEGGSPMKRVFDSMLDGNIDPDDCFALAHYLLNHGCDNEQKATLLCKACSWNKLDMVKELIEQHKVDPKCVKYEGGQSLLDEVLENVDEWEGHGTDIALYLISHGYGGDKEKLKLLFSACYSGKLDVVKELIEHHNISPSGVRHKGQSPMDRVCEDMFGDDEDHRFDLALYLVDHGCDKEQKMKLVIKACYWSRLNVLKELVEQHKIDLSVVKDANGRPPLDCALEMLYEFESDDTIDVALYLTSQGCNDNKLLFWACRKGKPNVVKKLVEQLNIDPNGVRDDKGESPLDIALQIASYEAGCVDVAHYLINLGCGGDKDKIELLCGACECGKLDVVKKLVEQHGFDLNNVRDNEGLSPLDRALKDVHYEAGCVDVAHYLINHGCGDDKDKIELLCGACECGKLDVVKELVEQHGFDLNIVRDTNNRSPLHRACIRGAIDVVKYLVEEVNCDINVTDNNGKTPLDLATKGSFTEIIDYLKSLPVEYHVPSNTGKSGVISEHLDSGPSPMDQPDRTPLSEEDSDALQKLLQNTQVNLPPSQLIFETVQQLLFEKGFEELATDLRAKLDKVIQEQQQYLKRLEDLMSDEDTIDLRYLKVFLVGPPGVGKTTTLRRLLKAIVNIVSAGDKLKPQSTLLANCLQVFAFVSSDGTKWVSSVNIHHETMLLFRYLCGCTLEELPLPQVCSDERKRKNTTLPEHSGQNYCPQKRSKSIATPSKSRQTKQTVETNQKIIKQSRIHSFVVRLQKVIKSEDHATLLNLVGSTLLNINDIGGQPGFLEMLPALSSGPALYLVMFDLSKELNKPYRIPFNRDDTIITPYRALHTTEATLSQILSAISSVHCTTQDSSQVNVSKAVEFGEKFNRFQDVRPIAALIGTHKDNLNKDTEQKLDKDDLKKDIEKKLDSIDRSLCQITSRFPKIVARPDPSRSFFAVDNLTGTDHSDIGPLREFLSSTFQAHFKEASLPIRTKWLWLSLILRREYRIVSKTECLEVAQMLGMDEDEVNFSLWYLHHFTGTLMYYPNISDEWLKNHIICSPQVIFDSISQLIVASLRSLHSEGLYTEYERKEMIEMGQFSIDAIEKYCACYQVKKELKKAELVPVEQLVQLLNHVNLLSPIIHKEANGSERVTYFMPAVLDCALPAEIATPPTPDANNPEPFFITFACGYVPTGTFCGLITQLVTLSPNDILGFTWNLVEKGVKRNYVSFYVAKSNKVTLICHEKCFEIRITQKHLKFNLYELCSHVLSVILYTLKSLYKQLVPHIAFQCPCPDHESSRGVDHLCVLTDDSLWIQFLCGSNPVDLRKHQQIWFGNPVTLGSSAELEVFIESDVFSFRWTKEGLRRRQIKTASDEPNIITFASVKERDLGYYRCEVKEAGRVVFTVYRSLYEDATHTKQSGGNNIIGGKRSPIHPQNDVPDAKRPKSISMSVPDENDSLKKLMEELNLSSDQLDCEIEEDDITYLAEHFDDVELYLMVFGLTTAEQANVRRMVHVHDNQIAVAKCLSLWRKHNPSTATLRRLLVILLGLKKEEVATNVCKFYCPKSK